MQVAFICWLDVAFYGCDATTSLLHTLAPHPKYQINACSANYNVWLDYNAQHMHSV